MLYTAQRRSKKEKKGQLDIFFPFDICVCVYFFCIHTAEAAESCWGLYTASSV
jgi:hypothetical protein